MEELGRLHGVTKSRTQLNDFTFFLSIVSFGEVNGDPLQCFCLENPMDGGAWWASLWGCKKSDTTKHLTHIHTHRQENSTKYEFHFAYIDILTLRLITKVSVVLKTLY